MSATARCITCDAMIPNDGIDNCDDCINRDNPKPKTMNICAYCGASFPEGEKGTCKDGRNHAGVYFGTGVFRSCD